MSDRALVCDHENGASPKTIAENFMKADGSDVPFRDQDVCILSLVCHTCGAEFVARISVDVRKKGKVRRTNRLWALLKGVT